VEPSGKTRDGGGFIVEHIENVQELRDCHQVDDSLIGREELEASAIFAQSGETTDDFPKTGAVQVWNLRHIQKELLASLTQEIIHNLFYFHIPIPEYNLPIDIDNDYVSNFSGRKLHAASNARRS
jgi:hypothetical protein